MQEIWKDIKNYEGLYQISNLGNVKSLSRNVNSAISKSGKRTTKEKMLSPCFRNGYKNVYLSKGVEKKKIFGIHRLVCEAFYRNILEKEVVNHIDYDRGNNFYLNLEIVTHQQNVNHSKHRMKKMKTFKTNTLEPYISKRKDQESYRVTISKKEKQFSNLTDAINYRNTKLDELGVKL